MHVWTRDVSVQVDLSSLRSFCITTPYPEVCFNSLNVSIPIDTNPNSNSYFLQSLQVAISETTKLLNLFNNVRPSNIKEKQRGAIQDCRELHQSTLASLKRSLSGISSFKITLIDARIYLSAALSNKNTCLEGLDSASGTMKPVLVKSVVNTYKHVSNSLSTLSNPEMGSPENQSLVGDSKWLSSTDLGFFQDSDGDGYDPNEVIVVAVDGTDKFSTITVDRTVIRVKEGIYKENVVIQSYKINIVMLGDGSDVTVITGNRSVGDGCTTFNSATLAVSGEGFLARDISFNNSAGPEKQQAVALRVNADLIAFYRCAIHGYQDTLFVHSFRQFYRECDIYGTIDFIFGNAAVVLQGCNIVSKKPLPGQYTVITAQSRDSPNENTGISIQYYSIKANFDDSSVKSYLGRPWRIYSCTVYLESYIDDFIDPKGWTKWSNEQGLDTLYYREFDNYGLGSSTDNRVQWSGYHAMDHDDAFNFTVLEFINDGHDWLESTLFPFVEGICVWNVAFTFHVFFIFYYFGKFSYF
ncbi:putative pectinesterase/pectinesterase inhibitor 12 [Glycine soja]